jgi:type III secretion protein Y
MMDLIDQNIVQLLHTLGYLYGQQGETERGLVLLLLASRLAPDDVGVLRTLVHAFMLNGRPERAIAVIERLRSMREADHPTLDLMMGRALWACGRPLEARRSFHRFLERRRQP